MRTSKSCSSRSPIRWKGKRFDDLERTLDDAIARQTEHERWAVFSMLEAICESIAADGPARLARSNV